MTLFYGMLAGNNWSDERAANLLDGGAPFYDTYRCADGKWISIGPLEPQFYQLLLEKTGLADRLQQPQMQKGAWPEAKRVLRDAFASKSRAEWCERLENTDVCFAPVLSLTEAPRHPHNLARGTFVDLNGVIAPAPAPRFSATPARIQSPPSPIGSGARRTLGSWGISAARIDQLASQGIIPP
jgi:alpha-methylacyl-CoA racemase